MDDTPTFVNAFASIDRARLIRVDKETRQQQLDARQVVRQYVEALWQDVARSGERPEVGDKYHALAVVRELTRTLTDVAFDAVYDVQSQLPAEPRPGPHG
jgi:hypothetical protein